MKSVKWIAIALLASVSCDRGSGSESGQGSDSLSVLGSVVTMDDTVALLAFLQAMPKGGDLHNHLAGAIPAEQMISWAAEEKLCVSSETQALSAAPCDATKKIVPASTLLADSMLRNRTIDAWTMRHWGGGTESGHDHFFRTFDKFLPALAPKFGETLAIATAAAARDHLSYLELMVTPDEGGIIPLGAGLPWTSSISGMRDSALRAGLLDSLKATSGALDRAEARRRELQHCDSKAPEPACQVTVRYLYQVLRGLPRQIVFTQILAGYEWASADPRVVGLNLVMPEDDSIPFADFDTHMMILDSLHGMYPKVPVTLHAGELTASMHGGKLASHIRKSIEIGHATRIGHGVAITSEANPEGVLKEMSYSHILVEVALTSNRYILGVSGEKHPLATYLLHHVPVALVTDDAGVSRSDMTHEFMAAVLDQHIDYPVLKEMARNSIEYSFADPKLKAALKQQLENDLAHFEKSRLVVKQK